VRAASDVEETLVPDLQSHRDEVWTLLTLRWRPRVVLLLAWILVGLPTASARAASAADLRTRVSETLDFIEQQLVATIAEVDDPDDYPRSTDPATGAWSTRSASSWTSGFFPGQLWLMYEHTENAALLEAAEDWTAGLASQASRTDTHDLGFMILNSFGHAYRITGTESYRQTTLTAAASLDSRFDEDVGATRSWDFGSWEFPVIIDNMMNLELMFWGATQTGTSQGQQWLDHAIRHADTTLESHVRNDGSTYQIVDFDPDTGDILSRETRQGYADESTWARGQAWGIYGFAMSYRESGHARFLATAMALADYFTANLPSDHVPYWDFDAPDIPDEPRDSSAAAIAASGLLELSELAPTPSDRARYFDEAVSILDALMSSAYRSDGAVSSGILLHATGNKPSGTEVGVSLIYGDYYFTEALLRHQKLTAGQPVPAVSVWGTALLGALMFLAARRSLSR
jgi:unsaturated chondroitin disaccharide hydrolase